MQNTIYKELRAFVKEHHGFGDRDFEDHPEIMIKYNAIMDEIRKFNNQRVKLSFKSTIDLWTTTGEKIGRIKLDKHLIKFYEGKNRTKFYHLDAGLFEGWYATLIPFTIEKM